MNAEELRGAARRWMAEDPDPETRAELEALLAAGDTPALEDRFGSALAFGTAGLRGPIGPGPNGLNRMVARQTAAGLAEVIRRHHGDATSGAPGCRRRRRSRPHRSRRRSPRCSPPGWRRC